MRVFATSVQGTNPPLRPDWKRVGLAPSVSTSWCRAGQGYRSLPALGLQALPRPQCFHLPTVSRAPLTTSRDSGRTCQNTSEDLPSPLPASSRHALFCSSTVSPTSGGQKTHTASPPPQKKKRALPQITLPKQLGEKFGSRDKFPKTGSVAGRARLKSNQDLSRIDSSLMSIQGKQAFFREGPFEKWVLQRLGRVGFGLSRWAS